MVREEAVQEAWREYTADLLALIAKPNYSSEIPLFSEMFRKKEEKPKMTAEDIKQHILKRLREYKNGNDSIHA